VAHHVLSILRRRLLDFLTILSLLLCLATVALWVRSYWRYDGVAHVSVSGDQQEVFESNYGELGHYSNHFGRSMPELLTLPRWYSYTKPSDSNGGPSSFARQNQFVQFDWVPGFGYANYETSLNDYVYRSLWFPHWFPVLLFAILPALRLRSILRTRRRHRCGLCPQCGYDLRATPERCPECGHAAPRRA
jgi:hypothetical protein